MMLRTLAMLLLLAPLARAEPPRVVTSIAPLQGIVTDIMEGVGAPTLLLDQSTSPHDFALRPSQLRALGAADVVFYIGLGLEPWLTKPLSQQSAMAIALGEVASPHKLSARELQDFGDAHEHEHDVEHNTIDSHVWLHPDNVLLWLDIISGILANADPQNAKAYLANAERQREHIILTTDDTLRAFKNMENTNIVISHDAIQYFEDAFSLKVTGTFSASDGTRAGAKTTSAILSTLGPDTCLVIDRSHSNTAISSDITIDPMGYALLENPDYYPWLLTTIATSLIECQP